MKYYLCGPIDHQSSENIHRWRDRIKLELGAQNCLDPSIREWDNNIYGNYRDIVDGDLRDINECDCIIANLYTKSCGSAIELVIGRAEHKLVLTCMPDEILSPFVLYFSDYVFNNFDIMLHTIKHLPTSNIKDLKRIFRGLKNAIGTVKN